MIGHVMARDMQAEDLVAVLQIEQYAQVMPWSRLSFEEAISNENHCRVILIDKLIAGFHVCASVLDEWHILNLAVSPAYQGKGLGHVIMQDISELAEQHASQKLFLEVRESNQKAQSLYQKWRFERLAQRKHYYRLPNSTEREHALVMVRLRANDK